MLSTAFRTGGRARVQDEGHPVHVRPAPERVLGGVDRLHGDDVPGVQPRVLRGLPRRLLHVHLVHAAPAAQSVFTELKAGGTVCV